MSSLENNLLEPLPDSLVAEAFRAANGSGVHESLGTFVTYCMNNGEAGSPPRCILDAATLRGPELLELDGVRRIVGVGPKTEITEDHEAFYANVERIAEGINLGQMPAPFVVERRDDGWYYLLDGNHTKMALQRHKLTKWWAIIVERNDKEGILPVKKNSLTRFKDRTEELLDVA